MTTWTITCSSHSTVAVEWDARHYADTKAAIHRDYCDGAVTVASRTV